MSDRFGSVLLKGDEPAAPTIKAPRRRTWLFWRAYGVLLLCPARRIWRMAGRVFPNLQRRVYDWLWRGGRLRAWLRDFMQDDYSCPCCGDDGWLEDDIVLGDPPKRVALFECVNSGADYFGDHWWEGWMFCYRCGYVDWHSDST